METQAELKFNEILTQAETLANQLRDYLHGLKFNEAQGWSAVGNVYYFQQNLQDMVDFAQKTGEYAPTQETK